MPEHAVVRRGVNNYPVKELGCGLDGLKPGDVFTDKGFLSTSVHKGNGFHSEFEFVIIVPKGAQGFYAEPFSHYTDEGKFTYAGSMDRARLWDGKSREAVKSEQEWIGQRGSRFRVLRKEGKRVHLLLIGQLR